MRCLQDVDLIDVSKALIGCADMICQLLGVGHRSGRQGFKGALPSWKELLTHKQAGGQSSGMKCMQAFVMWLH